MNFKNASRPVFYAIDSLLPRKLASIPYQLALESLASALASLGVEVWSRNSYFKGNFVFGVSDLDFTMLTGREIDSEFIERLNRVLTDHKRVYPFLGEGHFYLENQLEGFKNSANFFEVKRDPILAERLKLDTVWNALDPFVFLSRMIYYDRSNLRLNPHSRMKKWAEHLASTGLIPMESFSVPHLIDQICHTVPEDMKSDVVVALEETVTKNFDEQNVFSSSFSDTWKYIYPHRYLWFDREEEYRLTENKFLAKTMLRQIDWEVWGIMTQLHLHAQDEAGLQIHLGRLKKLVSLIERDHVLVKKIDDLLSLAVCFRS